MSHHKALSALVLVASFSGLVLGCDGGAGEEDTGSAQGQLNLFECGLPYTCEELNGHNEKIEPASAMFCGGKLIAADEAGVLGLVDDSGSVGHCVQQQEIFILLGDGTAILQQRLRVSDVCDDAIPWRAPSEQRLCVVLKDEGLEEACAAADETACLFPYQANVARECQEVKQRTCAEMEVLLQVLP